MLGCHLTLEPDPTGTAGARGRYGHKLRRLAGAGCITGLVLLLAADGAAAQANGAFEGEVVAQWQNGGGDRDMTLTQPLIFIDTAGKRWTAPAGTVINGASIPHALWSVIDPFIGPYRRASVVHDFYCVPPYSEPDHQVHRMFYEAALSGGTSEPLAYAMWKAIEAGGPHWQDVEIRVAKKAGPGAPTFDVPTETVRTEQRSWTPNVSAEELRDLFQRAQDPQADRSAIESEVKQLSTRNQPPNLIVLPAGGNTE